MTCGSALIAAKGLRSVCCHWRSLSLLVFSSCIVTIVFQNGSESDLIRLAAFFPIKYKRNRAREPGFFYGGGENRTPVQVQDSNKSSTIIVSVSFSTRTCPLTNQPGLIHLRFHLTGGGPLIDIHRKIDAGFPKPGELWSRRSMQL